jgi:hypothetical protein
MEIKDSYIFKYCSYSVGELIASCQILKFSNPKYFNDPFDSDIDSLIFDYTNSSTEVKKDLEIIKKKVSENLGRDVSNIIDQFSHEKIESLYKESQLDKISKSSVCCFSRNYENTTMWSHYADDHKGVCLIFDLLHDNPFIDYKSVRFTQGCVKYENCGSFNYLQSKEDGMNRLFLTKSKDWEYEAEYRFIILDEYGFFKFHPDFLKGVIFGLRVSEPDIKHFKLICTKNGFNNLLFSQFKKDQLKMNLEDL